MKSSGMNLSSGTRTRSVRFRGFTFALVLLSTCACTGTDRNVTAQAGQPAVLPCTCPPDQPPDLVWQKADGKQTLVVDHYRGEEDQKDIRAQEYRGRTELKLTENCSLKILNVTRSDQGLYTCYYQTGPIRHDNIYLEVRDNQYRDSEKPPPEELWSVQKTVVVCVLVIVIIAVAIAVYVGIIRKNIRQMNGDFTATSTRSI